MPFYWVWMDCTLLYVPQFFKDFFCWLLIYFYQTFCCCCLVLSLFFLSKNFSFLTGLSSLLGPLGFWHLALPVGVYSLECNNDNNNNAGCFISDPHRGCYMGLSMFIFFSRHDFVRPISLEPLLAETPNWVCCLVLWSSCALLLTIQFASFFFSFLIFFFFSPRFCPGHISGTVTRRDSKLSVLLGPVV